MRLTRRRVTTGTVDPLVLSGLIELASGALSGWVYTLAKADPDKARAIGIKSAARVRQWHLDLIALGGLTAMGGTAVPDLPRWVKLPLGIGAWTNAMLFLPLAFSPGLDRRLLYRAAGGTSFGITSVGIA